MSGSPTARISTLVAFLILGALAFAINSLGITQTVPMGAVAGSIALPDGRALPGAEVVVEYFLPEGTPAIYDESKLQDQGVSLVRSTRTNGEGAFRIGSLPVGNYRVRVTGKVHTGETTVQVREGETAEAKVKLTRSDPFLSLEGSQRVVLPGESPEVTLSGLSDEPDLDWALLRISERKLESGQDLSSLVYAIAQGRMRENPERESDAEVIWSEKKPIQAQELEGNFTEKRTLPKLETGIYLLRVKSKEHTRFAYFNVTRLGVILKADAQKTAVLAVDVESGRPRAGTQIMWVVPGQAGRSLGETKADGLLQSDLPAGAAGQVMVMARQGKDRAFAWFYRNEARSVNVVSEFVTDRPVYRPGDEVGFRTTLRTRVGGRYAFPPVRSARLIITSPDDTEIKNELVTIDARGTLTGSFRIPKFGRLGGYQVQIKGDGWDVYESVNVLSYRTPEYSVRVEGPTEMKVRGDAVEVKVTATAFTGEPLPGARVSADLNVAYRWSYGPMDPEFDPWYAPWDDEGEYIRTVEGVTGVDGSFTVRIPTGEFRGESFDRNNFDVIVRATVADPAGRTYEGKTRFGVYRGTGGLMVDAPGIGDPKSAMRVRLTGEDGRTLPAGTEVEVKFGREVYGRQRTGFEQERVAKVILDAKGEAAFELTPAQSGSYVIRAQAKDPRGNTLLAEASVWVRGAALEAGSAGAPALVVTLDKAGYRPGEEAEVLIRSANPNAAVLVGVEAERLERAQVIQLKNGEGRMKIRVTPEMMPNVEIAVGAVVNREMETATRALVVKTEAQRVQVKVTPDRLEAKPGETVTYAIRTLGADGKPVASRVAMSLVDEGVYRVVDDATDPMQTFYFRRWSSVSTTSSLQRIYLDAEDKAAAGMGAANEEGPRVRRDIRDTAHWTPDVATDANGQAKITVKLPDNLTSWRATVRAYSGAERFGVTRMQLVSKLPVMVRLATPSIGRVDDKITLTALVTNTTSTELTGRVTLSAPGLALLESAQPVTVPAGGTTSVAFAATVPTGASFSRLQVSAQLGAYSDALERTLSLAGRTTRETTGQSVWIAPGQTWRGSVQRTPDMVSGTMSVYVSDQLTESLMPSLARLVKYPYGCAEQTASRVLAAALWITYAGSPTLPDGTNAQEVVDAGLARLRDMQTGGGWGWFNDANVDYWTTAHVLETLREIESLGFVQVRPMVTQATASVLQGLKDTAPSYATQLAARALAATSADPVLLTHLRWTPPVEPGTTAPEPTPGEWISRALAWHRLSEKGVAGAAEERDRALAQVQSTRTVTAGIIGVETYGDMETDLMAIQLRRAMGRDVTGLRSFILGNRDGAEWDNTYLTATALIALRPDLTRVTPSDPLNLDGVVVNVGNRNFAVAELAGRTRGVRQPIMDLDPGSTEVVITNTGAWSLMVSIQMDAEVSSKDRKASSTSDQLTLTRAYFEVVPTRMEDGTTRLMPAKSPTTRLVSGKTYRCVLTVTSASGLSRVAIEDPLPAGLRAVGADRLNADWEWLNWWSDAQYFDDRTVFFAYQVPKGTSTIEYVVRAESAGTTYAPPSRIYPMYVADVEARSAENPVEVIRP